MVRVPLDSGRQSLYDGFTSFAGSALDQLTSAALAVRSSLQDVSPTLLAEIPVLEASDKMPPVSCALVPRGGLGAFTLSGGDGWRIAVHEHTPQFLAAFSSYVFSRTTRDPAALNALLTVDASGPPTALLELHKARPGDAGGDIAASFSEAAVFFVIAHELGHVLLGHAAAEPPPDPRLTAVGLPTTYANAREEIEADSVAALLLSKLPEGVDEWAVAGARVFFLLSHARLRRALALTGGTTSERYVAGTHPHPALRLDAVQSYSGTQLADAAQFVQGDVDEALGEPPLVRDPVALAAITSMGEGAPDFGAEAITARHQGGLGPRLDRRHLGSVMAQAGPGGSSAILMSAAASYVRANPYRWAAAREAIAFAVVHSTYRSLTHASPRDTAITEDLLRRAVPELDEIDELGRSTVYWAHG